MKLNICCGARYLPGYKNIDIAQHPDAPPLDYVGHAKAIPLPDSCAEEIIVIHGWEHFYRWECEEVLAEWHRLLQPGGLLVLELPDLVKCARNLINNLEGPKDPDQLHMWGIYGDPREKNEYMSHRWGWTPRTLSDFLEAHGFHDVKSTEPQWHRVGRFVRDMRIEARRM